MTYEVCYIYHKDTYMVALSVLCFLALLDIYIVSVTLEGRNQVWMYGEKSKMDGLCFPRTSSGVDSFICHNFSSPDSVFISLFLSICVATFSCELSSVSFLA